MKRYISETRCLRIDTLHPPELVSWHPPQTANWNSMALSHYGRNALEECGSKNADVTRPCAELHQSPGFRARSEPVKQVRL
jgi:hypothetical protein